MEIKGNIISFDNNSGHYKPTKVCFNYLKGLMINEYGFKYITTNKKQLTHFMKITMVFSNDLKSKRSKRSKRRKRSKRSKKK